MLLEAILVESLFMHGQCENTSISQTKNFIADLKGFLHRWTEFDNHSRELNP